MESFNHSIIVMVVGSLHTEEVPKHLFTQIFVIAQHQEGIQWHFSVQNDMLWRTDEKMHSPLAIVPLHLSNGNSKDCPLSHKQGSISMHSILKQLHIPILSVLRLHLHNICNVHVCIVNSNSKSNLQHCP